LLELKQTRAKIMPRRKFEKKILLLEPSFSDVLACRKKEFRPYLEVMIQEGENISHDSLGTLLGILEITDESEDSSYIVNFIISVIKKEYFSKGKRGAIESFESALHKANLALSKLAQHENINWIGKFNAIIAVIEKNNLHFSQAGKASALLLRNNILTDISEGMNEEDASSSNPLKTFTNLSSGKMEDEDKLILATPEIFDIFSLEEIKKAALRFSKEDFVQFLKTALGNELDKTAVVVADISQKKTEKEKLSFSKNNEPEINVFSQKTFIPKARPQEEKSEILNELENALEKETSTDAKHGHLYIKEEFEPQTKKILDENLFDIKKTLGNFWGKTRGKKPSGEKIKKYFGGLKSGVRKKELGKNSRMMIFSFWQKIAFVSEIFFRKTKSLIITGYKKILPVWKKTLPSFSGITKKIKSFSGKQKIYALLMLILIFIVPFYIARYINTTKDKPAVSNPLSQETPSVPIDAPSQNLNIIQAENIATSFSGKNIQGVINLNDSFFAISNNSLVQISSQKTWPVPDNFGEISKFTAMNDLNLIFLANKDNKILSFSPTSQKFQENILNLPENSQIGAMGTFMTYLYILDSKNSQIYRYPRAEGGFGDKTNWLKETADLSGYKNMFVTDSVYLWNGENFSKFFRGKKENMTLENYSFSGSAVSLYADESSIYILDKNEGLIKKFSTDGKFISQISSDKIKTAQNLAVSSDGKNFYLSSPEEIVSFSVE
jgi:hypothetical protein